MWYFGSNEKMSLLYCSNNTIYICTVVSDTQVHKVAERILFPRSRREQVGVAKLIGRFSLSKSQALVTKPPGSPWGTLHCCPHKSISDAARRLNESHTTVPVLQK